MIFLYKKYYIGNILIISIVIFILREKKNQYDYTYNIHKLHHRGVNPIRSATRLEAPLRICETFHERINSLAGKPL